ncbi:MAG: hypothetical protein K5655_09710 [Lachnospiraceae bacterium]|nr:hypothetical protein [Lachnospiraceae bacterium]
MRSKKEFKVITVVVFLIHFVGMIILRSIGPLETLDMYSVILPVTLNFVLSTFMFFLPAIIQKAGEKMKKINKLSVRFVVFIVTNCFLYGGITSVAAEQGTNVILFLILLLPVLWALYALFLDSGKLLSLED